MAKCSICSKGPLFGNRRSHAMNATRHMFKPNLVKRSFVSAGKTKNATVCTRCIRTMDKRGTTIVQELSRVSK